jgi:3-deoxy-D-manno-octulosonate 8-phosphate phosphatase (KDO 8-P phosphatase)
MNIKDGFACFYLLKKGYPVAIITGGNSESVRIRFQSLGIKDIYLPSSDKLTDFNHFLGKYDLSPENILYMGDDLPDYPVMTRVGFPACPADAVEEIKAISRYISDKNGGEGCVRDVIEQVLRLNGNWMDTDAFTW